MRITVVAVDKIMHLMSPPVDSGKVLVLLSGVDHKKLKALKNESSVLMLKIRKAKA